MQSIAARLAGNPLFWLAIIGALFTWPIVRAYRAQAAMPGPRPILGNVSEFMLKDQYGQRFGTEQLRGKVWVAQFFDARDPDPATFQRMKELQHRTRALGESFHLVSFTVRPERDDRRAAAALSKKHRASRRAWSLLTGPKDEVARAVGGDMGVDLARIEPAVGRRLALIDRELRIRGFYDVGKSSTNRLLRDAGLLVNRGD